MGYLSLIVWWLMSVMFTCLALCVGDCPGGNQFTSVSPMTILPFIVATSVFCHCSHLKNPTIGWALIKRFYQSLTIAVFTIIAYNEIWPQILFYTTIAATKWVSFMKACQNLTGWSVFKDLAEPSSQFWSAAILVCLTIVPMYLSLWELLARISSKDILNFRNGILGSGRKELEFCDEDTYYIVANREDDSELQRPLSNRRE